MSPNDDLDAILKLIQEGTHTEADLAALRRILGGDTHQEALQKLAKYNIQIQEVAGNIHIGDLIINSSRTEQASTTDLNFEAYLRSLTEKYQQWWEKYTLTDALGTEKRKAEEKERSAFEWKFDLMVQTAPKQEAKGQLDAEEKVEQFPVLEGIRKYARNHVLLVGRPGSGKSTALVRLLLEEATTQTSEALKTSEVSRTQIPVLVELRFWHTSILDRILAFFQKHDPELSLNEATVKALLRQGRLLLLMDGLNELPSEEARRDVARFRKDYEKSTPMIFTTRELSVGSDLGIEKKLEMQPLTEAQMQTFVKAYLPEQGEALLRQLKDRLREFGQVPLLLWMLCDLFEQTGTIPPNLGMVFRWFTQQYECNLKEDAPVSEQSRSNWSELLQRLAFVMMHENSQLTLTVEFRVAIARSQVLQIFEEWLQNRVTAPRDRAVECLNDLLEHHLIQLNGDQIEFRHQLLQEYYATESLLQLLPTLNDAQLKRDYLNYLKWTEPLALMLALVEEEAQAVRVVKLALNDVDLLLGARLAGEVKPGWQRKTVELIDALKIPIVLKCECWETSRSEQAIAGLLTALDHQDSNVRGSAAAALGNIGGDAAIAGLLTALDDQDSDVRWRAANALGNIGGDAAIAGLLTSLDHQDSNVRRSAAAALRNIGGDAAIVGLLTSLDHQDSNVRRIAAKALGNIGEDAAITGLLTALDDQDSNVRWRAAKALGNIGGDAAIVGLLTALDDQDSNVRWRAANALGNIGGDAAIVGLLTSLDHQDSNVRRIAVEALGNIGGDAAIVGLLTALDDQDSDVRWIAAEALGNIGGDVAIAGLWQARMKYPTGWNLKTAIAAIQSRCKFYNYEIAQGLAPAGSSVQVFFSYASEDEPLRDQLEKHLSALQRQDVISSWCDHQILPGDDTNQTLSAYLNTADIILLLISAHSLASNKCYDLEIQRAMERHTAGDAHVIPILLRPVDYEGLLFSKLPILPPDGRFVTQWQNQDEAYLAIAEGVKEVAIEVRRAKAEGAIAKAERRSTEEVEG